MRFDFACPDWADRLADGRTPIADLPLDRDAVARALSVFDMLRLPDVPGQPLLADAAGDWMRDIVAAIFGSVIDKGDGYLGKRMVREVFTLVPKKNAKTTSAAAIALVFMLLNERPRADMLIVGPTQKIAETAFEQARGMIEADQPDEGSGRSYLRDRFHIKAHQKTIECRVTGARLMIRTFGNDVLTGVKPIFVLVDETHILGGIPYAPEVFRQIRGGMVPFDEACLVQITTQSDRPPAGIFKTELAYARQVRDGGITAQVRTLPVLYEFPEDVQTAEGKPWLDPALWHLVTPNLGRSVTLDALVSDFERAKADGIEAIVGWATQHLNVEVGLALHSDRWRGADFWVSAGDSEITLDHLLMTSDVVTVGIDGGGLDDLAGLAVIGRHAKSRRWQHWAHGWAHPEVLAQRKEIAGLLHEFEAAGHLTICDSPTQDTEEMAALVAMIMARGLLPEQDAIGLDPYGIAALVDALIDEGVTDQQMAAIRQGAALSPAIWGLERKLKDGTFLHGAQPLMAWCVGNAVAEQRGNAVLITKQTAGKAKIDPLVATFNAAMLMSRNPAGADAGLADYFKALEGQT